MENGIAKVMAKMGIPTLRDEAIGLSDEIIDKRFKVPNDWLAN